MLQTLLPDRPGARELVRVLGVHVDVEPAQEVVVLAERGRILAPGLAELRALDLALLAGEREDDPARHLVHQRPGVRPDPVEAIGPDVLAGLRVLELRDDAQGVALAPDAAFEHVVGPQRLADLAHVAGLVAVGEGRAACDHRHVRAARQHRDHVLRDARSEIRLFLAGHAVEGQHRHHRRVRRRLLRPHRLPGANPERHEDERRAEGRGTTLAPCRRPRRPRRRDQPVAAARNRLDQLARVVAERLADLADALHQAVVGHHDPRPDRVLQLVLGHEPPPVGDQVPQHREGLRPKRRRSPVRPEDPLRVEIDARGAEIDHPVRRRRRGRHLPVPRRVPTSRRYACRRAEPSRIRALTAPDRPVSAFDRHSLGARVRGWRDRFEAGRARAGGLARWGKPGARSGFGH